MKISTTKKLNKNTVIINVIKSIYFDPKQPKINFFKS